MFAEIISHCHTSRKRNPETGIVNDKYTVSARNTDYDKEMVLDFVLV